ncbi:MAG: hypothetical protein CK424_04650 [Legionella sp.]|nr:MAG: hypothetical protein CK424_04650 [Legionella sp.]
MTKSHTFSERLNLCLDKLGFPPKHCGRIQLLADMVGLTHRGAGKWVNGQCCPPLGKFPMLAKQLQVNEHWLRTGEGAMCAQDLGFMEPQSLGVSQTVPVYSLSHLLQVDKKPSHTMTCILPYTSDFYGIVLQTQAMSPRFPVGSVIVFDALATPKDGDFVLAADPACSEPVFRQLLLKDDLSYLHAHNPQFERQIFDARHQVLGKLIQAIVSFS